PRPRAAPLGAGLRPTALNILSLRDVLSATTFRRMSAGLSHPEGPLGAPGTSDLSLAPPGRGRCYTKILTFSTIVCLVRDALLEYDGSGQQSFSVARFGPTTPTRARRLANASVDHTEVGHVGVDDTRVFQRWADVPRARR